jgi:hypothetical protein
MISPTLALDGAVITKITNSMEIACRFDNGLIHFLHLAGRPAREAEALEGGFEGGSVDGERGEAPYEERGSSQTTRILPRPRKTSNKDVEAGAIITA